MTSLKVLFVVNSLSKGGAAVGANNLLKALRTQNIEITVVEASAHQKIVSRFFRNLERVLDHLFFGSNIHFFRLYKPSLNLEYLVSVHSPDVIQFCNVSGNLVDYSLSAKDMPVVFHRMSDFWPYMGCAHYPEKGDRFGKFDRYFYRNHSFDLFLDAHRVAPSHWLISELANSKIFQSPIHFIPNAISKGGPINTRTPVLSHVKIGFVSSSLNDERKGLDRVVRFVDDDRFELNLFGLGNIDHLRFENCTVVSHGSFVSSDLPSVFSNFDILVCPSYYDNSPNVVLEAMSFGIPVIGAAKTGMNSYITADTGHLFDFSAGSKSDFFDLVNRIIHNYPKYREGCLAHIESFSPDSIGARYVDLYREVLGR
jgi:glycosyltransferase involved in cell wall biosynthesis